MSDDQDLKRENERLKEALKELRAEKEDALELVTEMREHLEEHADLTDQWIDVFDMVRDDAGTWVFDGQVALFNQHKALLDEHHKLIRDWNRFVGRYNATVAPVGVGRPLGACEAQIATVAKLRKAGKSLRSIAAETGLSLRTVRTITDNADGKGRTAERANELRKREFNRLRVAAFRAKVRKFEALPKEIARIQKENARLVKAAKGLAK